MLANPGLSDLTRIVVQIGDGAPFSIEILEFKTVSARDVKQPEAHTGEAGDSSSG